MILVNGKVWTVNPAQPVAQAVALDGNTILAVGSNEDIRKLAGPGTRTIDLAGRLLLPGFNDGENARARLEETGPQAVLHPVDQRVAHGVGGDFDLLLGNHLLGGGQRLQRAEGQRMQQTRKVPGGSARRGRICSTTSCASVVGSVAVEELRLAAQGADALLNFRGVRQLVAPVQVHAEHVHAGARQLQRGGLADPLLAPRIKVPAHLPPYHCICHRAGL